MMSDDRLCLGYERLITPGPASVVKFCHDDAGNLSVAAAFRRGRSSAFAFRLFPVRLGLSSFDCSAPFHDVETPSQPLAVRGTEHNLSYSVHSNGDLACFKPSNSSSTDQLLNFGEPVVCGDITSEYCAAVTTNGMLHVASLSEANRQILSSSFLEKGNINAVKLLTSNHGIAHVNNWGCLRLWDLRGPTGSCKLFKNRPESGLCAMYSIDRHPDVQHLLVTACEDGSVCFWDSRSENGCVRRVLLHSLNVWKAAFLVNNPYYLLSCSEDGTLYFSRYTQNLASSLPWEDITGPDNLSVTRMSPVQQLGVNDFDATDTLIVSCSDNGFVHLFKANF